MQSTASGTVPRPRPDIRASYGGSAGAEGWYLHCSQGQACWKVAKAMGLGPHLLVDHEAAERLRAKDHSPPPPPARAPQDSPALRSRTQDANLCHIFPSACQGASVPGVPKGHGGPRKRLHRPWEGTLKAYTSSSIG